MTIAILGAGAVGQLIAHQLASTSERADWPMLLGRDAKALTAEFCFTPLSTQTVAEVQRRRFAEAKLNTVDLIIVTVKAYQVEDALLPLLPMLNADCHILLLHNGLGPHEAIAPKLAGRGLSLGTTSQGALRVGSQGALRNSPTELKQTGTGLTQFGHFSGPALSESLKQRLLQAIPGSEWVDDILTALWQKLAVNACINPLTARDRVENGALDSPQYQSTIDAVIDELLAIAAKEGIRLDRAALKARVMTVIKLTAANRSSMRQDVEHGRKTEIDAINGYLVRLGERHGIDTPANRALFDAIKAIEAAA
ncbi:2-dehydropantoate 2-reductase [Shewanella sp. JM162201]|uniref:2-dehydropantoate 2-reductase n=1 Tax=Shewanella jiangmenensis TaxID=2837387 RepID=A0ABS5V4X4_9GAMM|nr:2-dehydropantoate 2-reductase [Shewanella jiangmenensis]MBT1444661.1 2-dehydropantoate 2-reductase [Shewanella jiangmenensis]